MHCLVYHVPVFMSRHGNIGRFSGQALEKLNDDIKRIHQQKTQKWDGPVEAMTVRKRVESQSHLARPKRLYTKRKLEYWESEIHEARSAKRASINDDIRNAAPSTQPLLDDLSVADLRDKLVSLGVHTKVSCREKLMDMISSVTHV